MEKRSERSQRRFGDRPAQQAGERRFATPPNRRLNRALGRSAPLRVLPVSLLIFACAAAASVDNGATMRHPIGIEGGEQATAENAENPKKSVSRRSLRSLRSNISAFSTVIVSTTVSIAAQPARATAPAVEWRSYAGDLRNHHYSPLDQVDAANFNAL